MEYSFNYNYEQLANGVKKCYLARGAGVVSSKNARYLILQARQPCLVVFFKTFPPFELSAVKPSLFILKCHTGTFQEAFPLLTFAVSICKELKVQQNNNELLSGLFVGKM